MGYVERARDLEGAIEGYERELKEIREEWLMLGLYAVSPSVLEHAAVMFRTIRDYKRQLKAIGNPYLRDLTGNEYYDEVKAFYGLDQNTVLKKVSPLVWQNLEFRTVLPAEKEKALEDSPANVIETREVTVKGTRWLFPIKGYRIIGYLKGDNTLYYS